MQDNIGQLIKQAQTILPIIDIDTPKLIIPTIEALSEGGIQAVEITLRSEAGLSAIALARKQFPQLYIAAGTVTSKKQIQQLQHHQVDCIVSPGISRTLLNACQTHKMAILPGVVTPSDILLGLEYDLSYFKFFPAETSGGVKMLQALKGPFPDLQFCATGGININNALRYLHLSNVFCIGGSWIASKDNIENQCWDAIKNNAASVTQILRENT
jgi:2-dehydro-3-deoxyphosphogluconate aldolase/(4S)-4-hydroxy-2-oxoglutarate aldolase